MSKLIANVCVDGKWFGPAHGNAEDVPAEVGAQITNPAAWDKMLWSQKVEARSRERAAHPANGTAAVSDSPPETFSVDPRPVVPNEAQIAEAANADWVETQYDPRLIDLDYVPDEKEALIAFRDAHDLDADGRLGVDKLRAALEQAIRR